jgi:N utilization substance protein B
MPLRRKAREFALQMLFRWEMNREEPAALEQSFWKSARAARETREFANRLFEGAAAHAPETETLLTKYSEHWRLDRMAAVDRNILRLAVYELLFTATPPKVVINEALELAKKFSSEDSAAFLNGVLDAIHKAKAASGT